MAPLNLEDCSINYSYQSELVYLNQDVAITGLHLNFATQGIYLWAIGFVKISIGLLPIRFAPNTGYRIFIWTVTGKCCMNIRALSGNVKGKNID
jgi:hypothetical protein